MLEGDLGDFTLPDILQLLAFTSKSGRLSLHGEAAAGRVDIDQGHLVDATSNTSQLPLARRLLGAGAVEGETLRAVLSGHPRLPSDLELAVSLADADALGAEELVEVLREQTLDAVFDLVRWEHGTFRFDPSRVVALPEVMSSLSQPVDDVLGDARRRLEEWPAVEERTGPPDAVVTIARPAAGEVGEIASDGWALLALIDGRRDVQTLVTLSGQGEFRTRRTLADLVELGVVAIGAREPTAVERLLREHELLAEIEAALRDSGEADAEEDAGGAPPTVPPPSGAPPAEPAAVARVGDTPAAEPPGEEPPGEGPPGEGPPAAGPVIGPVPDHGEGDDAESLARQSGKPDARGRLRTDPSIDEELLERLIDGMERL